MKKLSSGSRSQRTSLMISEYVSLALELKPLNSEKYFIFCPCYSLNLICQTCSHYATIFPSFFGLLLLKDCLHIHWRKYNEKWLLTLIKNRIYTHFSSSSCLFRWESGFQMLYKLDISCWLVFNSSCEENVLAVSKQLPSSLMSIRQHKKSIYDSNS